MSSRHIAPPLKSVFLCQCVDNSFTLLIGFIIAASGLSLYSNDAFEVMTGAGAGVWLGLTGLLAFTGVFYRLFFILFWGVTPGCRILGLRPRLNVADPLTICEFFLESFQIAAPCLWFIDVALRSFGLRFGLGYAISYDNSIRALMERP